VDTIRALAHDRHFYTVDVRLEEYGQVLVIGDRKAVERLTEIIKEHGVHDLEVLPPADSLPSDRSDGASGAASER
jgi:hypothetical protein